MRMQPGVMWSPPIKIPEAIGLLGIMDENEGVFPFIHLWQGSVGFISAITHRILFKAPR